MPGRIYRIRSPLETIEIELRPSAPSANDAGDPAWVLRKLFVLGGGEGSDVWRMLRRIHEDLVGGPLRGANAPRPHATMEALLSAARSGRLRVRAIPVRRVVMHSEPPAPPDEPPPAPAEAQTWYSLKVLDEVGAPVDGIDVAYSFGSTRKVVTTNGAGVARLDRVDASSAASATLASIAAVREKLKPRWAQPRDPDVPTGDGVTVRELGDAIDGLSLVAETPATLVLTPYFQCHEVPGAHFDFGRSFVRSSALDVLASIAEALSADDGRKGLIFGHTDLAGPEALNKELSERRAKALFALMTHDAAAWEELFSGTADGPNWHEKWDVEEAQHMLNALGVTDDAGNALKENGVRDAATRQAIHRFQAGNYPDCPPEQEPLDTSDVLGPKGRKQLFLAYAKRVTRKPVDPARFTKLGDASFMGCGEFNPMSLTVQDEESRRAVIFLFDPAAEPQGLPCQLRSMGPCKSNCGPLPKEPDPDGKPPYRCKIYQGIAKKCPCQAGPDLSHDLILRFPISVEDAGKLPHVYSIDSDDGTIHREKKLASDARANAAKRAELYMQHLPETHLYKLTCDEGDGPYTVLDFAKLPELQARTGGSAAYVAGDTAELDAYWIAHQNDPPTDGGSEGDSPPPDPSSGENA